MWAGGRTTLLTFESLVREAAGRARHGFSEFVLIRTHPPTVSIRSSLLRLIHLCILCLELAQGPGPNEPEVLGTVYAAAACSRGKVN